jgi:hypothetical protein
MASEQSDNGELSPFMQDYYKRRGIQWPPVACLDVLGHELKAGDRVYVARNRERAGTTLDVGQIVKIDVKNQRVLIDWSNSPIETRDIHYDRRANGGKGGVVDWPRRKSWIWNGLCGLVGN